MQTYVRSNNIERTNEELQLKDKNLKVVEKITSVKTIFDTKLQ